MFLVGYYSPSHRPKTGFNHPCFLKYVQIFSERCLISHINGPLFFLDVFSSTQPGSFAAYRWFEVAGTTLVASFQPFVPRLHWWAAAVCWDQHILSVISFTRLLIYGQYCSHMENAQKTLDELIATREDIKVKVEVKVPTQNQWHFTRTGAPHQ